MNRILPDRILLIRLKSIGDVVLTLPAVQVVRQNFPSAKITFLTSKENAPLLRGFRDVDEIITIDRAKLQTGNPVKIIPELFGLLRRLRAGRFSLVADFQGYGETAWLSWWSGAPERWGSLYGPGREWLYTCGVKRNNSMLIADWNLSFLLRCGMRIDQVHNRFILPDDAVAAAREFFFEQKLDPSRSTLFVQSFTSSTQKDWPVENYLRLAAHYRERGMQVIFGGGPANAAALAPAFSAGYCVAVGQPLLVSAGLVMLSTVTIGGVTGLLHLAVAMQKRVVMLIGPANEPGFPYQHRDWGLRPKSGENVSDIQISDVIEACAQAFSESVDSGSC